MAAGPARAADRVCRERRIVRRALSLKLRVANVFADKQSAWRMS